MYVHCFSNKYDVLTVGPLSLEAVGSSKTLEPTHPTVRRHSPKGQNRKYYHIDRTDISMEETKAENIVHNEPAFTTNVANVCQHVEWATHMRISILML